MILDGDLPDIDDIYIDGDKQKLGQVMRNLISNALKFTPSGGTVTVRAVSVTAVQQLGTQRSKRTFLISEEPTKVLPKSMAQTTSYSFKFEVSDSGAGISQVPYSCCYQNILYE